MSKDDVGKSLKDLVNGASGGGGLPERTFGVKTPIVAVEPTPAERPATVTEPEPQKGPQDRQDKASTRKRAPKVVRKKNDEQAKERRMVFRVGPDLEDQILNGAYYATAGDYSKFLRRAAKLYLKHLVELNGGKEIPRRPEILAPILDALDE